MGSPDKAWESTIEPRSVANPFFRFPVPVWPGQWHTPPVTVMKMIKGLVGLALLPLCAAATLTLADMIRALPGAALDSVHAAWFAGGFVFWSILFVALPRPTRSYVLAHELTHALWGVLMGAKVHRVQVGDTGGSVTLSKSNVWITLAPYFFPFYTVLATVLFFGLRMRWSMDTYLPFWAAVIGLTWAYHVTFTLAILRLRQPDIHEHGRLFSYSLIYLMNLLTVALALGVVAPLDARGLGGIVAEHVRTCYLGVWTWLLQAVSWAAGQAETFGALH